MNKEQFLKTLPGELPKEDLSKIEPFFMNDLSTGAKSKPTGNINNYVYLKQVYFDRLFLNLI